MAPHGLLVAVCEPVDVQKPAAHAEAVADVEPEGQKKPMPQEFAHAAPWEIAPVAVPHVPALQSVHEVWPLEA